MMQPPTLWPNQTDAHRFLAQVGIGRATANYKINQRIYNQGEDANYVYFVQEGRVKLTAATERDLEMLLGTAEEGQFFGEACLYDVPVRKATATTTSDCRITSVTKEAILSAVRDRPKFGKLFIDHLLDNNSWVLKGPLYHLFSLLEVD